MKNLPKAARDAARLTCPDEAEGLILVPGTRQRLGDQLYRQLYAQIRDGRLKEGERLPSEIEISGLFGVSRPIVRTALLRSRLEGLVHARQGSGTYVMRQAVASPTVPPRPEQFIAFLHCVEVRMTVEPKAACLAARRHSARAEAAGVERARSCGRRHPRRRPRRGPGRHAVSSHPDAAPAARRMSRATGQLILPFLLTG